MKELMRYILSHIYKSNCLSSEIYLYILAIYEKVDIVYSFVKNGILSMKLIIRRYRDQTCKCLLCTIIAISKK